MAIREGRREASNGGSLTGRLLGGRWRVGRLIGRGGTSAVYAATHRNGRQVAVKVLDAELTSNPRARARFQREGYIASRVRHEGVVSILDDDVTDDGTVFTVMEILHGATLEEHRRERGGTLPVEEVLLLTDHILDVLGAAHAGGVIHRDVKPSNVFLTTSGQLKLLDFGIASLRELSAAPTGTRSGALLGTPGFVAPEQARGRWREVDPRTDLWGVGATMFRLLSGRLVHEAETANEAVIAAATEPAPSLASIDGALSAAAELVDKALRAAPGDRWQSAAEMQAAVRRMQATVPPARFPIPRPPPEPTTLDESGPSDAGAAGEAPLGIEPLGSDARAPAVRAPRARVLALAITGGAAIAIAVFAWPGRRASPKRADPIGPASTAPVAATEPAHVVRERPAEAPVVSDVPVVAPPVVPVPAPPRPRRRPPRASRRVAPAVTETAADVPAPPEAPSSLATSDAPARLEDVLGDRH